MRFLLSRSPTAKARKGGLDTKFPVGTIGECIANALGILPIALDQEDIAYLVVCTRNHRFGPRD